MSAPPGDLSVSQARDHLSDERYEALVDQEDGRLAIKRLADLDAGRTTAATADEVARALDL